MVSITIGVERTERRAKSNKQCITPSDLDFGLSSLLSTFDKGGGKCFARVCLSVC